jgi:hypothetical protein
MIRRARSGITDVARIRRGGELRTRFPGFFDVTDKDIPLHRRTEK